MVNPAAGPTAQSGVVADQKASNYSYKKDVLSNKIFNKNIDAGLIARDILLGNKKIISPKPNLKHSRSRSSSESSQHTRDGDTSLTEGEFITPSVRRRAKVRKTTVRPSVSTQNRYMQLSDSEFTEAEESTSNINSRKKTKANKNKEDAPKSGDSTSSQAAPNKPVRARPPPIYVQLDGIKATINVLSSNGISATNFIVREFDETYTKVFPANIETYDLCIALLKKLKTKYFTYTPRHLKTKTIVLKGIRGGFDEKDVQTALVNLNLIDITISKVSKLTFDRSKPHLFHFLVSAPPTSSLASLTRQKSLLSQPIRWERLRKPIIFMCKRCQQTGHSSANCQLDPVCVKCAGNHESKDCIIEAMADKSSLKCINCGGSGHPANYKGCPALKLITKVKLNKKRINEDRRKRIANAINNYTNPKQSYADTTSSTSSRQFPPLPKSQPSAAGVHFSSDHFTSQPMSSSRNKLGVEFSSIEELLISFKNDIIKEFKKLNEKIISNTSRIDQIMAAIFTDE